MQAEKTATCTWPPPVNMSSRRAPNSQRIRHSAWLSSARCTACRRMPRRLILQARHGTTHTSKPGKRAKTPPSHPRPEKERFPEKNSAESVQSPSIVFTSADVFRAPERHGPFRALFKGPKPRFPGTPRGREGTSKGHPSMLKCPAVFARKVTQNRGKPCVSAKTEVELDASGPC